ncbi:hypothetical protein BJV78DRAFT_823403 [Lactifluus subvellereus]|nr:hypothetical protein BJV78DRAFT_823403 [Lactifluus subvellereus]
MQCSIPAVGLAATVYGMMRRTLFRLPLQLRAFSFPKVFTKTKFLFFRVSQIMRQAGPTRLSPIIIRSLQIHLTSSQGFQQNRVVRYSLTPGIADNDGRVHGPATTNAQAHGTAAEGPGSSEALKTLARRYILDPGTNVDIVRMEPSVWGRLKVTITLEVADDV